MKTREEWLTPAPTWESESAVERAQTCLLYLCVHDLITDAEKRKVRERLRKQLEKGRRS